MTCVQAANQTILARYEALAEIEYAERKTLMFAEDLALKRSSGTATERVLSMPVSRGGLGHPYGHGSEGSAGPRGPVPNGGDAGVVNVQTGEFLAGWRAEFGSVQGGQMTNSLINDTEHAKFIEDTPSGIQIGRPFLEGIAAEVLPVRLVNLQDAFRRLDQI